VVGHPAGTPVAGGKRHAGGCFGPDASGSRQRRGGSTEEEPVKPRHVKILEGRTFVVSDVSGDVDPDPSDPAGLFYRDMRHLSRWQLRLNGRRLHALSGETVEYDEAVFYLAESTATAYEDATVSLIRRRHVGEGMHEFLDLTNHGTAPVWVELTVLFDADFADIFQVKGRQRHDTGQRYRRVHEDHVTLGFERGDFRRETRIHAAGAYYTADSLTLRVTVRRAWKNGSPPHPAFRPTGTTCTASTGAAWSTSPPCTSTPTRYRGLRCPRPGCRGTWLCSAGTA
jgi:hypothetical protein